MKRRSGLLKSLFAFLFIALTAISFISTVFSTWLLPPDEINDNANTATNSFTNSTKNPICINEKTGVYYSSLLKALTDANASATSSNKQTVTVLPGKTITINDSDLLINSYVTLKLPFIKENEEYVWDVDAEKSTSYSGSRVSLLNMRNGRDIRIQTNGFLNVGGVFHTTGNRGKFCEVNLGANSSIEVYGTLNCYGFIRECSSDAVGFFSNEPENLDNGNDSGRLIDVKSGGTLNTFMNIRDAMSGSALGTVLQSHDLCPFDIWDFNAIQTYTKIENGGSFNADAIMVISNNTVRRQAGVVGNGTSGAILLLGSGGSASIEYCPKNPTKIDNTKGNHYTNIVLNGNVSLGTLHIDGISSMYLDTGQCFMPFSYNFNVYVNNGSVATFGHKVKFLPGSLFKICEGGELVLTSDLVIYQEAQCPSGWTYPSSGDAKFYVDGTFTCTGNIGALIETTSGTEDGATLDFSGINSDSRFTATATETLSKTQVKVDSKGYFLFGDSISESTFTAQETYTSGDPSIGHYWKGNTVVAYTINVTINSMGYTHPISSYVLSSSDTSSGTKSEIVSTSAAYSTTIPVGKYLTVNWQRAAGATIMNGSTQVDTSNGTSKTFLVTGTVNIEIQANDSIIVYTQYGKDYWQDEYESGSSGGHTYIKESKTSSGTYTQIADLVGGAQNGSTYVAKGSYFKVSVEEGTGFSDIEHKYVWKPENIQYRYQKNVTTGRETHNESTAYQAYGNYAFYWEWKVKSSGGGCVIPGTLVTMADGTKRQIKDIIPGDEVLAFNHETGQLVSAPVVFNEKEEYTWQNVIYLEFSNGSRVGVVSEHGFFDLDTMRYEYIDEFNYQEFVGHRFYSVDSNMINHVVTLDRAYVVSEYTECYELPSFYHLDFFTEDILSIPGGITGLFNIFEYGENLQYEQEAYARDIETYGLFTYEDLAPLGVTEIMFNAYAGKYLKVALGKGVLTEEYLTYLIERYGGFTE